MGYWYGKRKPNMSHPVHRIVIDRKLYADGGPTLELLKAHLTRSKAMRFALLGFFKVGWLALRGSWRLVENLPEVILLIQVYNPYILSPILPALLRLYLVDIFKMEGVNRMKQWLCCCKKFYFNMQCNQLIMLLGYNFISIKCCRFCKRILQDVMYGPICCHIWRRNHWIETHNMQRQDSTSLIFFSEIHLLEDCWLEF